IFDYALQATRAGLKFGSVWGFEDSMHLQSTDVVTTFKDKYGPAATTEEGRQYKVHTPTGDPNIDNDIKIWGFWNELGEEMAAQNSANNVTGRPNTVQSSDEKIRPWYYTWSMFCRYFPAGMKILETTDSGIDAVRATAGLLPNGDKSDVSIAVVNSTGKEKTIELNVPNANGLVDLNQYFYYDGEINGKSRPVNEKGQVLPYGIIKDASLSKGVEVTLPANSCMILTSLGYNGESHPMSLTTGQKPDVNKVNIFEESGVQKLSVGETYQISTKFTPSISSADMEWKVTDYFGQPSSLATINEKGLLTVKKPGQFKVEGSVKGHPEIKDTITFIATSSKVLVDVFNVYDEPSVGKYENIVKDDKPSNFNNVQTVKRSDTNKPAYITYQADGIYDFEFDAYSLHSDLGKTDNFLVEASVDNQTWEKIECDYIAEAKLSTNWYKISVTDKAMDTTKNYQYLRITLQSHNGYKVYDPQYGGGSILYGDQGVSEIIIDNKEEFVVKGETLELSGSILPSSLSQDIEWSVVNLDGTPTTKASINNNVLTAKETGQVVIIAQPKDHSLSCYYPMNIVGGYIEDDIKNYDLMYDHGSFVYEGSSAKFDDKTIIKRTDDTPQSLVYSYNGIQKATFEVYSNGSVSDENVDIYVSKDGLHYEVLDKTITRIGPASPSNTEYQKYEVSAFTNSDEYNFIKFEVKNDSKVYRPMIGKVKIIYNPEDNAKTIDINVVNSLIKMNLGSETTLDVKIAPANSQPQLTYESLDESIASIDKNGKITAKKLGSTYVIARVNDQIYTRCVVNVYENFAYKKNVEVSGTYAGGDIALNATDGDYSTRWASLRNNNQYITVDLGKVQTIDTVKIFWEAARAKDYRIEVAGEDGQFKVVKEFKDMTANSLNDLITFDPMEARYVKMQGITPIGKYGYSIYEFEVYNNKNIVNVENIELSEDTKELYLNQDYELNIQVNPSQATYSLPVLSSSHENIVSIKDHRLKAVGVGEAIITVEADEKVTQLKVKVVKANAQKYADELDTLNIQDGKIVFPSHEGYTYSIYSTDHKKVISKDGIVHMPIKTTDVSLIVEVKGEKDVAYSKIIHVVINGNEDCLHHIEKLIADMKALDSHLYKPSTLKTLNEYIKATEDLLTQSDLLVDEVQEAHEQILSLYEKLEYKADRTTLDTLLKELSQLDKEFYTANSYQQLLNVIKDVQTQINDESSQEDIEKAIIQLQ
ncbi:MAG: discoidin domain-containing protein, partial [Longibaculum sp.]